MKNFMVEIMEDVMSNRAEKEERKKKLHDLLDKYRDDVRALDGDPGLDGIDFMFAKPYLDEVLEERRVRRERQSVVYDNKSNMGEAFREDIKKRREDGVEKVIKSPDTPLSLAKKAGVYKPDDRFDALVESVFEEEGGMRMTLRRLTNLPIWGLFKKRLMVLIKLFLNLKLIKVLKI